MSTTYEQGGPGRKKCECGVFVAARTTTCPKCGHVFVSRVAAYEKQAQARSQAPRTAVSDDEVPEQEAEPRRGNVLLVPSGRCPVELEATDRGAVQEWAYLLQGSMPGIVLSRYAALQFLRQFFTWGSPEFVEARSHLSHCRALHPDGEFRP